MKCECQTCTLSEHYIEQLLILIMMAGQISELPLNEMKTHHAILEAVGPIFDPTACINGGVENLREQKEILNAATPLWDLAKKLKERIKQSAANEATNG